MLKRSVLLALALAGAGALAACGSSSGITPVAATVASVATAAAPSSNGSRATTAAVATAAGCTSTTADAGSLRGLAAGDGCGACAQPAPSGKTTDSGSLRGLAADESTSAGSLRGLAAGGGQCTTSRVGVPHKVVKVAGKHAGKPNCPATGPASVQCDSQIGDTGGVTGVVDPTTIPGLQPGDLMSAYNFSALGGGANQVVGIVDAYDDPNAEADMAVYRSEFGLPPCTSASGCFTKIGSTRKPNVLPKPDASWASEIALDLDMVSAVCPKCKIVLVEANSDQLDDLAGGVDAAVLAGATVISNSYYIAESRLKAADVRSMAAHFSHPGIPITASSGDRSFGATFPASLANVIAVGGTTLVPTHAGRGWAETAWHGSGAGCSTFVPKPAWQSDPACGMRTLNDIAVVADPDTGVAVYDTYGGSGWYVEGGTSVGAPVIAAMIALAGNGSGMNGAAQLYANASAMFPVEAGSDGTCASYLCNAVAGYDGPTGLGSPNGLQAL